MTKLFEPRDRGEFPAEFQVQHDRVLRTNRDIFAEWNGHQRDQFSHR